MNAPLATFPPYGPPPYAHAPPPPVLGKDGWRTPRWVYSVLDAEFGFRLDCACDTDTQLAPTGFRFDHGHNGLALSWYAYTARGTRPAWCNPPYSALPQWLATAHYWGHHPTHGVTSVLLVPYWPDRAWWHDYVHRGAEADGTRIDPWHPSNGGAAEVRTVRGRFAFDAPPGAKDHKGGQFPLAFVVFRPGHVGPPVYSTVRFVRPRQGA